jgi:putative NADPH-quinone reductase
MSKEMRKHIDNFKRFQLNETFITEPGGYLDDKSTDKDKFIYKINELSWLKDRFELHMDKLTNEDVEKYLGELTKSINNIHEILNNIRK